jgi:hypothetical protein
LQWMMPALQIGGIIQAPGRYACSTSWSMRLRLSI